MAIALKCEAPASKLEQQLARHYIRSALKGCKKALALTLARDTKISDFSMFLCLNQDEHDFERLLEQFSLTSVF